LPSVYTDGLNHLDLQYSNSKFGKDTMKLRNAKAKQLRKEGWTVKCGHTSFEDLARDEIYWIEAKIPKTGGK